MKAEIQIDDVGFRNALRDFKALTRKSWPEVLRGQGRLAAVNLSLSTQPYGKSQPDKFRGRIETEIRRVFPKEEATMRMLAAIKRVRGKKARLESKEFERLSKYIGNPGAVEELVREMTKKQSSIVRRADPAVHRAARIGRRRSVPRKVPQPLRVLNQKSVDTLVARKQRMVGFAKAGWAVCAQILGGARGLPGWVTRHSKKAPGSVVDRSTHATVPTIILSNDVRYATDALPPAEAQRAMDLQAVKFIKSVEIALARAARAARL